MSAEVINLKCGGCGRPVSTGQKVCEYCGGPITISTFNSVSSMPLPKLNKYVRNYEEVLREHPDNSDVNRSIAFVYLKLKNYEKAREYFERAMEDDFDDAENYFYAAVTILKGKKAFMTSRDDINKAEEYIQAAISIEPRGIFYYFWAYIRYDHHARKFYKVTPSYTELVEEAFNEGVSDSDIEELFEILGQSRPEQLPLNG